MERIFFSYAVRRKIFTRPPQDIAPSAARLCGGRRKLITPYIFPFSTPLFSLFSPYAFPLLPLREKYAAPKGNKIFH